MWHPLWPDYQTALVPADLGFVPHVAPNPAKPGPVLHTVPAAPCVARSPEQLEQVLTGMWEMESWGPIWLANWPLGIPLAQGSRRI